MTNEFGAWLDRQIDSRGWGRTEASRQMGVSHSMVSQWITGVRRPNAKSVKKIAKGLSLNSEVVLEAAGLLDPGDTPDPNSNYAQVLGMVNRIDWETYPDRLATVKAILDLYVKADERERAKDDALEREVADDGKHTTERTSKT